MNQSKMLSMRMERQGLLHQADEISYLELYRDLQPGQNVYWHGFGTPPVLSYRAAFDDTAFNAARQGARTLVKGRFQGGNLGWLDVRDLELFACMCQKPLDSLRPAQETILQLLQEHGAMSIQEMKAETGMLVKAITPVLHRLQEAFLVYEDQFDGAWDRSWCLFTAQFPGVDLQRYSAVEALRIVLQRFCYRLVWFDADMAKAFYRVPMRTVQTAIDALVTAGVLCAVADGYCLAEDRAELEEPLERPLAQTLFVLHRNDFLFKVVEPQVKAAYRSDYDLLQVLLIDGEIHGSVQGAFRYGPYEIEDVVVDEAYQDRRDIILRAVQNENPDSIVLRYCGEPTLVVDD